MEALIIIDMQRAYFKTPGLIARQEKLIGRINALISEARRRGDLIVNVRTVHAPDKQTWTLNMLSDNQGFAFEGSDEIKNLPGLHLRGAVEIIKTRDSAFQDTALLQTLQDHDVSAITLTGVSTHSCIFHTAAHAYAYNIPTLIDSAGVDDEDGTMQQQALDYLHKEYRQTIV